MNTRPSAWHRATEISTVLVRWLLGAAFIYFGLNKAMHPVEFLKLIRQYDLVQAPLLLNSLAAILPWFEVFCGLLLLFGVAVRGTALLLIVMLVPFTIVVFRRALAIQSALSIPFCAVKFDCGCGSGEAFICRKLLENFLFLVVSGWLLAGRGRKFCVRHALLRSAPKPTRPLADGETVRL